MRAWNARSSGDMSAVVATALTPVSTICAYINPSFSPRADLALTPHALPRSAETIHFFYVQCKVCIIYTNASRTDPHARPDRFLSAAGSPRQSVDCPGTRGVAAAGAVADHNGLGGCHCPSWRRGDVAGSYPPARTVRYQRAIDPDQRFPPRARALAGRKTYRAPKSLPPHRRGREAVRAGLSPHLRAGRRFLERGLGAGDRKWTLG